MEDIEKVLLARGYKPHQAKSVTESLLKLDTRLNPLLEAWISSSKERDYKIGDISISFLMKKFGLHYPAALLTIDWLIREPERAIEAIKRGVK